MPSYRRALPRCCLLIAAMAVFDSSPAHARGGQRFCHTDQECVTNRICVIPLHQLTPHERRRGRCLAERGIFGGRYRARRTALAKGAPQLAYRPVYVTGQVLTVGFALLPVAVIFGSLFAELRSNDGLSEQALFGVAASGFSLSVMSGTLPAIAMQARHRRFRREGARIRKSGMIAMWVLTSLSWVSLGTGLAMTQSRRSRVAAAGWSMAAGANVFSIISGFPAMAWDGDMARAWLARPN